MDDAMHFTLEDLKFESFDTMPVDQDSVEALSCTDCSLFTCGLTGDPNPTTTKFTDPCQTCPLPTDEIEDDEDGY